MTHRGERQHNGASERLTSLISELNLEGSLDAVLLLKQTGIPLAGWTRVPAPHEVISAMAATVLGSLDTMLRTLGGDRPQLVVVEVDNRRILVTQVKPNRALLLVAPRSLGKRYLLQETERFVRMIEEASPTFPNASPSVRAPASR